MMYQILSAFPVGSEDWDNMIEIVKRVGKIVGSDSGNTSMSAVQQMALAAKRGGPLKAAPPIGIQPSAPNIKEPEEPEPV